MKLVDILSHEYKQNSDVEQSIAKQNKVVEMSKFKGHCSR